jgi:hypothetical protein
LADAATANAKATRNATLRFLPGMASRIATPPMTNAAMRAVLISCFSVTSPFLITLA